LLSRRQSSFTTGLAISGRLSLNELHGCYNLADFKTSDPFRPFMAKSDLYTI
jgi:hypothetical protein